MQPPSSRQFSGGPPKRRIGVARLIASIVFGFIGLVLVCWFGYALVTWMDYGSPKPDALPDAALDHFMPVYEVDDHQQVAVNAPWTDTYAAECLVDLQDSPVLEDVLSGRARLVGATPDPQAASEPTQFVAQAISFGWGVLAEDPGHEIILGAVSKPWESDVTFLGVPPDQFEAFQTPGFAKIILTLDAEPTGPATSVAHMAIRVETTDADARDRFRRYWASISPGIALIRSEGLDLVRTAAERRYQSDGAAAPATCAAAETAAGH